MTHHLRFVAAVAVLTALAQCAPVQEPMPETDALRARAEAGDAEAQFDVGFMYAIGDGVPEDDVEAARWYRLAAEQGDADGQFILGFSYGEGEGVPQDDTEAVRWFRLAADQGFADAQNRLGRKYANGQGVPQDDAEAVRWFRLAAEQGDADGQFNLGDMYENGIGVPQDYVQAHMWYNLRASREISVLRDLAVEDRDLVADKMTPTQIAEAQRLAREWDAAHPREP